MKKFFLLFFTLFLSTGFVGEVWGQTTIASQDFETTPASPTLTFTYTNGTYSTGTNGSGRPANSNLFVSGTRGWQVLNATSTLIFANHSLSGYTDCYISFRLAGMNANTTVNGIDAADIVTISISVDGGTTYSSELTISGSAANQYWDFTATGSTSITYDGDNTPTPVTSSTGSNGITTATINIPNSYTQVRVKIAMLNNSTDERWVIDDVKLTGTLASGPANPASFTAATSSATQINLSATANANSNNIMVAWNSSNTFGTPTGSYNATDPITGGGTVLHVGTAASLTNHTGLTANTQYFYKTWSVDGSNEYSTGLTANATTAKIEPTNQVTSFAKGTVTTSAIPLSWTAATAGSQAPDGYLVKLNTGAISDPVDGTDPNDVTAITDGAANKKVTPGSATSTTTFTGMSAGTMYNYKIYSYTNSGSLINFNTTSVPSLSVATLPNAVTSPSTSGQTSTSLTLTWTAATGYNAENHSTLVFVKQGSAVTAGTPTNAPSTYTANTNFNSGTAYQADANAYCVYNGDGTSVTVTGLSPNTAYHFSIRTVVDASNSDGTNSYSSNVTQTGTTTELTAPTASTASSITTTSFTANWSSVAGAESYRLDVSTSSSFGSTIISENFSGFTTNNGSDDRGGSLNTYLQTSGWTGTAVYEMVGYAKLGASSTRGIITTPTINLSVNEGNCILEFELGQFGTDADKFVQVLHAADGTNFSQIGSDISIPNSITAQTVTITGGTINSKIRIQAKNASANRFYLDNVNISYSNNLTEYNNKTVNPTFESVTGLTAGTTYYYRVRANSTNSTSTNSAIITVTTLTATGQNPAVSTGSNQTVPVPGATGVGSITFANVTNGGNVIINTYNNAPSNHGLSGNVSNYRWIIEPNSGLVFNQGDGYTLRFEVANCPGITELADGNNTDLQLYKRSTPGSGAFTGPIALTYHRNGTNGNQTDDYITSALITTGFSEFVFQSPSQPLPVELASFNAVPVNGAVKLIWQTSTEINNHGFDVERAISSNSSDDLTWETLAFVKGNGNSNSVKEYSYTDNNISASGKYAYRLKQLDTDGAYKYSPIVETDITVVLDYALEQNYPNPFNPSTTINYSIPNAEYVTIKVFNTLGEEVATLFNGNMEAGKHSLSFDASKLSSGMYIYRLSAGNFIQIKKMLLAK